MKTELNLSHLLNKFVNVKVMKILGKSLVGELV